MSTSKSVLQVFKGFIELSTVEQGELLDLIRKYAAAGDFGKRELRESVHGSVTKMQTGPHSAGCPCCGR